ncbi:MAG: hypothetical protein K2X77_29200 [Candidatus Obscuribacterales bacterium]|nr:hypothetical protein [Candidatus Obscuribacterales bacterium]
MPRKKKTDNAKPMSKLAPPLSVQVASQPVSREILVTDKAKAERIRRRQDFLALDEAIAYWLDQLQINPDDEKGVRHLLIPFLVEVDRLDEASVLLKQFSSDCTAHMLYSRALLTFKKFGPCPMSDTALKNAVKQNPSVLDYICGADMPPVEFDSFEPGSKEEAVVYLEVGMEGWLNTDGAVIWLIDYLMEELTKFNHSMEMAGPKFENANRSALSSNVMDFSP